MGSSKLPLIVVALLGIVIIGGVSYYVRVQPSTTPTTSYGVSTTIKTSPSASAAADETANWKTYENTDYHYSVKYPPTWSVDLQAKDANGNAIATFLAPGMKNGPHD